MSCPAWCIRDHKPGDLTGIHGRTAGEADGVCVQLIQADPMPEPKVFLGHWATGKPTAPLMVRLGDAGDLATMLARLGHEELAALITAAASFAKEAPADADSR